MRLNTHPFTLKLLRYHPRVVCFVGKKIWDMYESVVGKTAVSVQVRNDGDHSKPGGRVKIKDEVMDLDNVIKAEAYSETIAPEPMTPVKVERDYVKNEPDTTSRQISPSPTPLRAISTKQGKSTPARKTAKVPFDWTKPRPLRLPHSGSSGYTYFWVVPNTSGLERTPVSMGSLPDEGEGKVSALTISCPSRLATSVI